MAYREPVDSGPLELDQLSDHELAIIVRIERRLHEAGGGDDLRGPANRPKHYVAPAEKRPPRVLLLDGDRGTGKTSLLLTLIHRWNPDNSSGVKRHDPDDDRYRDRIERLRTSVSDFNPDDKHDFIIPKHVVVLGRILDFDPLPPAMPLVAGIIQALRPMAETFDRLSGEPADCEDEGDTLEDRWHQLFRVAVAGWADIRQNQSLIEQVLDREEQVKDWHRLDYRWREFIDKLIDRGKCLPEPHRFAPGPVLVVMIDDVDLQVGRIRELLPALRLLYHPRVVFVVAGHREHMIHMLEADFYGQQIALSRHRNAQPGLLSDLIHGDPWSTALAQSSVEKVFARRNRWTLRRLSVLEFLAFPGDVADLTGEGEGGNLKRRPMTRARHF